MGASLTLSVQCLLLMAQYRQGTQRSDQAWNLHGMAVRAGLQLGLHSQTASSTCSILEAEVRKRVWFACMILDRSVSPVRDEILLTQSEHCA